MIRFLYIASSLLTSASYGASCCMGGNPKSFISLARLQKYEVGLSTSVRDVYGRYDIYGDTEPSDRNRTLSLSLGAGARLTPSLQTFAIVPLNRQVNRLSREGLGDILVGAQYVLVENLYVSDWYPTVTLSSGVKIPTGSLARQALPGTGNGLWEPYVGISAQKPVGDFMFILRGSFTWRIQRDGIDEGDIVELAESVGYQFNPRLSATLGLSQNWALAQRRQGTVVEGSHARVVNAFGSATYFIDRFWSLSLGVDVSLPIARLGMNQQLTQSLTLTTRYGFF